MVDALRLSFLGWVQPGGETVAPNPRAGVTEESAWSMERGFVTSLSLGWGVNPTEKGQPHMAFHALEVAERINLAVAPLARVIAQHDADLARQIRKAATSIPANLAEGRRRVGKDRLHLFRIADGSAAEVMHHLKTAAARGFIGAEPIAEALTLLDRELAMTWRLTHPR